MKTLLIKRSFAARLSFNVIILTALLFLAASVVIFFYSRNLIRNEAIGNAYGQLKCTNQEIENVLTGVSVAVDNLVEEVNQAAIKRDKDELFRLTAKLVKNNQHIVGSTIAMEPYYFKESKYFSPYSLKGSTGITTSQVGSDNYVYHYMEWYQIPKQLGHSYWTDPFYDEGAGNMVMCTYTHPLYGADGSFIGVFTADLPIGWLTEMVGAIKPYEHSYNVMIGKGGSFIVHKDTEKILNHTIFTATVGNKDTTQWHLGKEMLDGKTGMVEMKIGGINSFVFFAPIPSTSWSTAMVCPLDDVYSGVTRMNNTIFFNAIFALILLFVFVRSIVKKTVKPLTDFSVSARSIADGNFKTVLPEIETEDEMRELRDSFNYMQNSLTIYIEELKNTTSVKERIESELNIAREIQMGMIPKIFPPFPERNDVDLFAMLRPAKEVGGDLYDFFIDNEKLYFVIGDVSGKGVPASLFMAVTRSLFRSVATTLAEPKLIVESMNKAISESNEANMFVTLFVGVLDLKSGNMKFCNAGHNPPALLTPESEVIFMKVHQNLPVGLFGDFSYDTQEFDIAKGTTLFLYTDGLTEAENIDKELFNENRLVDSLKGENETDAETLIRKVLDAVENHVGDALQSDDLTMLVVKYLGDSADLIHTGKARLVIKNEVNELHALSDFIDKIGESAMLSPALIMSLNLAMEEAVSNVIFYAYPSGETNHTIEIRFNKKGKEISFTIEDSGVPFDPTAKEDADITLSAEERKIGGLGIYMVKQIMDNVVYKREGEKNILTMTKNLE